ncbi:MAG: Na+-driven multidrug efflux pump, partial [Planctomycetota bacterium]
GALGAAVASTIAYTVGTIWTVFAYGAQTNISIWECLFVQPKDFRYIRDILGAVLNKLRRK